MRLSVAGDCVRLVLLTLIHSSLSSVQTLCRKKEGVRWRHQQPSGYIANPINYGES